MLVIRLSRGGKHKSPFFRVVLTEHTKPVKSGYKLVLGRYDPLKHASKIDSDLAKEWVLKGAQPSNRVAKLLKKETGDKFWDKYIKISNASPSKKNASDDETSVDVNQKGESNEDKQEDGEEQKE